jgi:general secretion pathway protein G
MKRKAFTMVELVFVIVVLGILAAIAIPKFAATRTDAQISSARATIAAVRSGIVSARQQVLLRGKSEYINKISDTDLFDGNGTIKILMYPLKPSIENGHWSGSDPDYVFHVDSQNCGFKYDKTDGTFKLKGSQPAICGNLDF